MSFLWLTVGIFCFCIPYNWSFYHQDPIEGEEGGILLFHFSMINVYGYTFNYRQFLFKQKKYPNGVHKINNSGNSYWLWPSLADKKWWCRTCTGPGWRSPRGSSRGRTGRILRPSRSGGRNHSRRCPPWNKRRSEGCWHSSVD